MRKKIYRIIELDKEEYFASKVYDRIMQISIIISIIPLMFRTQYMSFVIIEAAVTIIFSIDYILRWITADYKLKNKSWKSFVIYPFTFIAILDLLTILPIFGCFNNSLRVFRIWRLLRLLRIAKVFKYYEPLQIVFDVFREKSTILLTVVGFALFYIFPL